MEMEEKTKARQHFSSPLPNPPPPIFKDISNFKTPKPISSRNPNFSSPYSQQFFTASKQTPKSSSSSRSTAVRRPRPSLAPPSSHSKAVARRLKAFELEQSKSARKAQIAKEKSLKSLATSLTAWLNFLFEKPRSVGYDNSRLTAEDSRSDELVESKNGKREIRDGDEVAHDKLWRRSKRQRDLSWCHNEDTQTTVCPNSMFLALRSSLSQVCSFDDLKERMRVYLSLGNCKEIFEVMTQVTKNIDDGRIKMKAHCSIVTDVGMKERAMKILMSYDPIWLRVGLYIIFGGNSLIPDGDVNSEQEISFLKMVIENQFFSHAGLAEAYAYNKLVAGLYRPGYFEKLGSVILKRFFLLVIVLDRAKLQSSLPISHGIDGVDGGSPLLFTLKSNVKSSHQMIHDFLSSEVMHGEGNLLAHLVIVGYKVFYEQSPLTEYDFRVTDLFQDLQDGIRLCRAIQLLNHNSSILSKVVVPSDTRKKNLANCNIAFQHLKQAGVPLHDEDGIVIVGDDIVNGDKELTLALLWNIFVYLQLPTLVNKVLLAEEIIKIRGVGVEHLNTCTLLDMLLHWIQAVCGNYDCKVDSFASMVDGRAMWCLLDYYFRKEHHCSCSFKEPDEMVGDASVMSARTYTDAVHNFLLSQKLTTLLGKFPEVLQVSDLLEHNGACSDRSIIVLLVFLSFQLIAKNNTDQQNFHKFLGYKCHGSDRKRHNIGGFVQPDAAENQADNPGLKDTTRDFNAIMAWWREMAQRSEKSDVKSISPRLQSLSIKRLSTSTQKEFSSISCKENEVNGTQKNAASKIQHAWRVSVSRNSLHCLSSAATKIQSYYRSWMLRKDFVNLKHAVITIQSMFKYIKCWKDFQKYKCAYRSALIIQSHVRGWTARREAGRQRFMILVIQRHWRGWLTRKEIFNSHRIAATDIQHFVRGWIARKRLLGASSHAKAVNVNYVGNIQKGYFQSLELKIVLRSILRLQRWWRSNLSVKSRTKSVVIIQAHVRGWIVWQGAAKKRRSIVLIQSHWRGWLTRKELFHSQRIAAIEIQRFIRGTIARKRLLGASSLLKGSTGNDIIQRGCFQTVELKIVMHSVLKLQMSWRHLVFLKARRKLVAVIQAHVRGWIARQGASKKRQYVVLIQSHWRGWLIRKEIPSSRQIAAAIKIQHFVKGMTAQKRLLQKSSSPEFVADSHVSENECVQCLEQEKVLYSVLTLQKWWRDTLLLKARMKSILVIQAHVRGWLVRQGITKRTKCIIVIQSRWKGYLARKHLRGKLLDLRLRVQKSAANVDDTMRIINRLKIALSELLSMKSVSGILHTCDTLDTATRYSQKCCEELVAAGAIDTLLKLIRSVSRSIPDQEVLRHSLSTLRNLARYPNLTEVLINCKGSVQTIFWEFLRNKEEGYFIAYELLEKICLNQKGVETLHQLPVLFKRLSNLVDDLQRRVGNEKRNSRALASREYTETRLRVAKKLLELITNS